MKFKNVDIDYLCLGSLCVNVDFANSSISCEMTQVIWIKDE